MPRYIDVDELIDMMTGTMDMQDLYLPIHFKEWVIDETPTARVQESRSGHWTEDIEGFYHCSSCDDLSDWDYRFCPNCGAKMDKEVEE